MRKRTDTLYSVTRLYKYNISIIALIISAVFLSIKDEMFPIQ